MKTKQRRPKIIEYVLPMPKPGPMGRYPKGASARDYGGDEDMVLMTDEQIDAAANMPDPYAE